MQKNNTTLDAQFLAAYDAFVSDIFTYFLSQNQQRASAKILTQQTFMKTWKELSSTTKAPIDYKNIYTLLRKNAELVKQSGYAHLSLAV